MSQIEVEVDVLELNSGNATVELSGVFETSMDEPYAVDQDVEWSFSPPHGGPKTEKSVIISKIK